MVMPTIVMFPRLPEDTLQPFSPRRCPESRSSRRGVQRCALRRWWREPVSGSFGNKNMIHSKGFLKDQMYSMFRRFPKVMRKNQKPIRGEPWLISRQLCVHIPRWPVEKGEPTGRFQTKTSPRNRFPRPLESRFLWLGRKRFPMQTLFDLHVREMHKQS